MRCFHPGNELWDRVPDTISKRLKRGPEIETPKSFPGIFHSFVVVTNDSACISAKVKSEQLGYNTHLFTSKIEGESRKEAISFVSTSNRLAEIESNKLPLAFIAGGETVVTLERDLKGGGPNQEFALSAALEIAGCEGVVVGAIGTDGTDGPTGASGGLVDGFTIDRARSMGLDPDNCLQKHLSGRLLEKTGDLMITGPTGTNVNDLILMLIDHD
jgi:glycerate 2-kinase